MPEAIPALSAPLASSAFSDLDRHFARFIGRFAEGSAGVAASPLRKEWLQCAAAALSQAMRHGHICLHLAHPPAEWPAGKEGESAFRWPSLSEWFEHLSPAPAVTLARQGGTVSPCTPLTLDESGRLYLSRYYAYEQAVALALLQRSATAGQAVGPRFPEGQEEAREAALSRPFFIISGGPGTGKTTTLVKILTQYLTQYSDHRIALAAPTGKAAARMEEAIRNELGKEPSLLPLAGRFPRAQTLDGLLGTRPMRAQPWHHAGNPLTVDLLVVDEASMIALPLMAKLLAALPPTTRVLLLGDRDQLASVAPGNVLGDLAEAAMDNDSPMAGTLAILRKNYRFGNESTIYRLSELVRDGDAVPALALLEESQREAKDDFAFQPLPAPAELAEKLRPVILKEYRPALLTADPAAALEAFGRFRLLAAVRQGAFGVESLNRLIEELLREAGLLPPRRGGYFAGMPLLITRNDNALNLRNGDIGIILPDPSEPEPADGAPRPLWAWFPGEAETGPRRLSPSRLPESEPAFAMTIHKSQGSEFQRVLMLLPDRDLPILTRELIYTGLTRARTHVELWAPQELLAKGIARRTERHSGLRRALGS